MAYIEATKAIEFGCTYDELSYFAHHTNPITERLLPTKSDPRHPKYSLYHEGDLKKLAAVPALENQRITDKERRRLVTLEGIHKSYWKVSREVLAEHGVSGEQCWVRTGKGIRLVWLFAENKVRQVDRRLHGSDGMISGKRAVADYALRTTFLETLRTETVPPLKSPIEHEQRGKPFYYNHQQIRVVAAAIPTVERGRVVVGPRTLLLAREAHRLFKYSEEQLKRWRDGSPDIDRPIGEERWVKCGSGIKRLWLYDLADLEEISKAQERFRTDNEAAFSTELASRFGSVANVGRIWHWSQHGHIAIDGRPLHTTTGRKRDKRNRRTRPFPRYSTAETARIVEWERDREKNLRMLVEAERERATDFLNVRQIREEFGITPAEVAYAKKCGKLKKHDKRFAVVRSGFKCIQMVCRCDHFRRAQVEALASALAKPAPTEPPRANGNATNPTKPNPRRGPKAEVVAIGGRLLKRRQVDVLIFVRDSKEPPLEKHIARFCKQKRVGGTLRAELNELYEIGYLLRGEPGWKSPGIRITSAAVEALAEFA